MTGRLVRPVMMIMAGASAVTLSLAAASTTSIGANALRGMGVGLVRVLHAAGLSSDAMAGAGGPASLPSTGGGSSPMTLTVAPSAELGAKLLVSVPVTVSCAPLAAGDLQFGNISAQILEAQGRSVVQGFGYAQLPANACDGTNHTYIVGVLANPSNSSRPSASSVFKVGQSVVLASAFGCDAAYDCAFGNVGPQVLRIVN
jgi:hypothetical protein